MSLRSQESPFIDELSWKRPKRLVEKLGDSFRTHVNPCGIACHDWVTTKWKLCFLWDFHLLSSCHQHLICLFAVTGNICRKKSLKHYIKNLLQNQNHSHSWLFYFHSVMNTTNLSLWFLQWWDYYGCHVDYLKEHPLVENGYLHFKNNFQSVPSERKFSSLLIFCTNFFVPWVCLWFYDYNLQNGNPVLVRKFKIKWQDSFAAESKSSKLTVTEWLQKHQTTPIIDHHPQSKFLA